MRQFAYFVDLGRSASFLHSVVELVAMAAVSANFG